MRYFLLSVLAITLISCEELEVKQYEYHSTTMMGRTSWVVNQDSTIVSFQGRGEPWRMAAVTPENRWNNLNSAMKGVDLLKVSSLEAPSNKRATDAAPFGKFVFVGKDSTITSSDFDDGNPHEMLKPLMQVMEQVQVDMQ